MSSFPAARRLSFGARGDARRPIRKLSEINAKLQRGFAAAEDIFKQLDSGIESNEGNFELDRAMGQVSFKDVSFRYTPDGPDVLKNIHLDIAPGQNRRLCGPLRQRQINPSELIATILRRSTRPNYARRYQHTELRTIESAQTYFLCQSAGNIV